MDPETTQFIYSEELYKLPPRTIVLLPVPWETLSEDQVTLLGKILGSVKLSLAGVQMLCREQADIHELEVFNPSVVISFGTRLLPESETYTATETDGIRIIQSDALDSLDDTRKKSLWNVLRQAYT